MPKIRLLFEHVKCCHTCAHGGYPPTHCALCYCTIDEENLYPNCWEDPTPNLVRWKGLVSDHGKFVVSRHHDHHCPLAVFDDEREAKAFAIDGKYLCVQRVPYYAKGEPVRTR